jgi:hypothetical protein
MNHNSGVGHRVTFAFSASAKEERTHRCSKTEAVGLYIATAHHHGIVDTHASSDGTTWGVDEEFDVLGRVLRVQKKELTNQSISSKVIDLLRFK